MALAAQHHRFLLSLKNSPAVYMIYIAQSTCGMIAEIEHGSTETDSEKGLPMQSSDESSLRRVGKSSGLLTYLLFNAPPLAIEFQGISSTGTVSLVVRLAFHEAE